MLVALICKLNCSFIFFANMLLFTVFLYKENGPQQHWCTAWHILEMLPIFLIHEGPTNICASEMSSGVSWRCEVLFIKKKAWRQRSTCSYLPPNFVIRSNKLEVLAHPYRWVLPLRRSHQVVTMYQISWKCEVIFIKTRGSQEPVTLTWLSKKNFSYKFYN